MLVICAQRYNALYSSLQTGEMSISSSAPASIFSSLSPIVSPSSALASSESTSAPISESSTSLIPVSKIIIKDDNDASLYKKFLEADKLGKPFIFDRDEATELEVVSFLKKCLDLDMTSHIDDQDHYQFTAHQYLAIVLSDSRNPRVKDTTGAIQHLLSIESQARDNGWSILPSCKRLLGDYYYDDGNGRIALGYYAGAINDGERGYFILKASRLCMESRDWDMAGKYLNLDGLSETITPQQLVYAIDDYFNSYWRHIISIDRQCRKDGVMASVTHCIEAIKKESARVVSAKYDFKIHSLMVRWKSYVVDLYLHIFRLDLAFGEAKVLYRMTVPYAIDGSTSLVLHQLALLIFAHRTGVQGVVEKNVVESARMNKEMALATGKSQFYASYGFALWSGVGCSRDRSEALQWFRDAEVREEDPNLARDYAHLREDGETWLHQDCSCDSEAKKLSPLFLSNAAWDRDAKSMFLLAECRWHGVRCTPNREGALALYKSAAEAGHKAAQQWLRYVDADERTKETIAMMYRLVTGPSIDNDIDDDFEDDRPGCIGRCYISHSRRKWREVKNFHPYEDLRPVI